MPEVYGVAVARLGANLLDEVDDTTQETIVGAWQTLTRGGSTPDDLGAWLRGIAAHKAAAAVRKAVALRGRESLALDPVLDDPADPVAVDLFVEVDRQQGLAHFRQLVADAVNSMSPKYRDVIRLNMYEGLVGATLAARLGLRRDEIDRLVNEGRPILVRLIGTLMVVDGCRQACSRLDSYLQAADWQGGPFDEQLRQRLMQHIAGCNICEPARRRAMTWVEMLPVVVPIVVPEDLHRRVMDALRREEDDSDRRRSRRPVAAVAPGRMQRRTRRRRRSWAILLPVIVVLLILGAVIAILYPGRRETAERQVAAGTSTTGPTALANAGLAGTWQLSPAVATIQTPFGTARPRFSQPAWRFVRDPRCSSEPCRSTLLIGSGRDTDGSIGRLQVRPVRAGEYLATGRGFSSCTVGNKTTQRTSTTTVTIRIKVIAYTTRSNQRIPTKIQAVMVAVDEPTALGRSIGFLCAASTRTDWKSTGRRTG